MFKTIHQDLLLSTTKYIVHQCNCKSKSSLGLARNIFRVFPWADTYSCSRTPGTIDVLGNGLKQRFVINLYGQVYPGKPVGTDTTENRLHLFVSGLERILKIPNLESIAFPWKIGCGLAGGNWEHYQLLLEVFAKKTTADVLLLTGSTTEVESDEH